MGNRILYLPIKKRWFDMILANIKKEEYREIKPYWIKRLIECDGYDIVRLTNGYGSYMPAIDVEVIKIDIGKPKWEWSEMSNDCFRIHLGEIKAIYNVLHS